MRREEGITLVSLMITIVLMLIIASTTVYTSYERFEINNLKKMYNDIELLSEKVSNYYLEYNTIPVVLNNEGPVVYSYTTLPFNTEENDVYYILDLEKMKGITLNYGENGFKNLNSSDDVYIINKDSHQIYYVKGIEMDSVKYYTIHIETLDTDIIPPSKPQINVLSGTLNNEGIYITDVEIEIVHGKSKGINAERTVYSLNDSEEIDITTLTNNILKITEDGTYEIKAKSYDENGNVSGTAVIQVTRLVS